MTDKEIRKEMQRFSDRIFSMRSSEAYQVRKEFEDFCKRNHVTTEQSDILAKSGAGEMLYMMTGGSRAARKRNQN